MSDEYRLLGDQPSAAGRDALGFHDVAGRLAEIVLASRSSSPFTVGIDGGWGAGKSSLMMRLRSRLDESSDVETIWFNAWTAEGKDVLEGLIKSVLNRIDSNILRRAMRRRRLISVIRVALLIIADFLRVRGVADEIWRQMENNVEARNEVQGLMRSAMSEWTGRDSGTGARLLVVFIDDLDRCSPANVLQVFEAMKLYLDAPGFVFIIGYDKQVISEVILRQLGYGETVKSTEYLEKIVQFTYAITPPTDLGARDLVSSYLTQSNIGALVEESERAFLIDRSGRNPRRMKRFINNFVLAYRLDPEWREIGAENLVRALILQMYYPEVVSAIWQRRGSDLFQECINFAEAKKLLRSGALDDSGSAFVESVFSTYNLDVASIRETDPSETLRILQEEIPELVLKGANDPEFVKLARAIGLGQSRQRLLQKLELRWQNQRPSLSEVVSPWLTEESSTQGDAGRERSLRAPADAHGVFISYRREDAGSIANRVYSYLNEKVSPGQVFMDIDDITPGDSFLDAVIRGVSKAAVVLVLIGPNWLSASDEASNRRLDDPDDFVRLEVGHALNSGQRVVPVLLDGARMPIPSELPQALAGLSRRQAFGLRSSETFESDMARLATDLAWLMTPATDERPASVAVRPGSR